MLVGVKGMERLGKRVIGLFMRGGSTTFTQGEKRGRLGL